MAGRSGSARGSAAKAGTFGWPNTSAWVGTPTGSDLLRFQIVYDVMVGVVGLIGLVWAIRRWRAYQIDRWTETHPRPTPSRTVADR